MYLLDASLTNLFVVFVVGKVENYYYTFLGYLLFKSIDRLYVTIHPQLRYIQPCPAIN